VDAADLYRLTGGNPFFVTEVIAAPGTSVPPTVADAVLARVSRLEPQVKAVLEWISVEPRPTERWLLEKLGHDPAAIDRALRSGTVIGDDDTVRFRHELARRALLETLDPTRVRTIHAAILEALDAAAKIDAARLSHHAMGAGDDAALLRWATRAGRIAALNRSHREAAGHFADAIAAAERSAARMACLPNR
jgi:predicted ATPase